MNRVLQAALRTAGTIMVAIALVAPLPLHAQAPGDWDGGRIQMTRQSLEDLLTRFDETATSEAYSPDFRARARFEAALIRARLQNGDFQIGDQIAVAVEGERDLAGNYVVNEQRGITLPVIGEISLRGVLRSELKSSVTEQVSHFIKDPVVTAHSSIRILISGEVAKPGFYVVDTQSLLSDALMLAGGPAPVAKLTAIRVERGNAAIWAGSALQQAIAEGRTMDQLSLRAGDHVVVPSEKGGAMSNVGRAVFTGIPALVLAISSLSRFFGR
jgi:polysaccharide export outer membrane protein